MRSTRILANVIFLLGAIIVESVWLTPLRLPGAVPPLVLVVTLAIARTRTPANAALIGFAVGLLADLAPPSTTPLGVTAFAFTVVAFAASYWRAISEGSTSLTLLTYATGSVAVQLLRLVISIAAGVPGDPLANLLPHLISAPIYAVMLATVVQPLQVLFSQFVSAPRQRTIYRG